MTSSNPLKMEFVGIAETFTFVDKMPEEVNDRQCYMGKCNTVEEIMEEAKDYMRGYAERFKTIDLDKINLVTGDVLADTLLLPESVNLVHNVALTQSVSDMVFKGEHFISSGKFMSDCVKELGISHKFGYAVRLMMEPCDYSYSFWKAVREYDNYIWAYKHIDSGFGTNESLGLPVLTGVTGDKHIGVLTGVERKIGTMSEYTVECKPNVFTKTNFVRYVIDALDEEGAITSDLDVKLYQHCIGEDGNGIASIKVNDHISGMFLAKQEGEELIVNFLGLLYKVQISKEGAV